MIWEIAAIEEGEGLNDVLITVHYWHGERGTSRPDRKPDLVEEHLILSLPERERKPLRTPIGQFIGLDGHPVMTTTVVDGELIPVDPEDIADEIQWDHSTVDDLILGPLVDRAIQVAVSEATGEDRFSDEQRPRPRGRTRVTAVATRRRDDLVGYRGVI